MFNNLFFSSLISLLLNLIDVLAIILPILLAVAFMTIIERKQLAAHQRRVGPNTVGWGINNTNIKNICKRGIYSKNKIFIRNYHQILDGKNEIIKSLYKNRIDASLTLALKSTWKPFESEKVDTIKNITSTEERNLFFNKYKDKGGIYLIQYTEDLNIYYIGRTKNLKKRLNVHLKTKVKDKFHLFANLVGWEKFQFSIVEICELNLQQEREDFYLKKYLPLLNTVFKSNFSESQIYETLYSKLKARQDKLETENIYTGISIFVYTYDQDQISNKFIKYNSINTLSKNIKICRSTIKRYLNTHVPYKNYLFYTNYRLDLNSTIKLINANKKELNLNRNSPKKVLAYKVARRGLTLKLFSDSSQEKEVSEGAAIYFESREEVARFLNVQPIIIRNHVDSWIKGGIKGYYLFSRELNKLEKEKLIKLASLRKTNNCEVWVYYVNNLESTFHRFNSMQKAADHFKVNYRSILRHLDTNKVTIKNNKSVLFFSTKLTSERIKELKVENVKNETLKLWVYTKINNKLVLINNEQPSFDSKYLASKELKISHKTINKYLDTNNSYKDLFFYSHRQNYS